MTFMAVTFTCLRVRQLQPRAGARLQSACGCARGRPAHLSAPLTVKKSVTRTMLPGSSAPLARAVLANETGMQLMPSLSDAAYTDSPLCKDTCLHNPNRAQAEARSKETNAISAAAGLLPHLQPCAPTCAQKQPYSAWQASAAQGPARLGSRVTLRARTLLDAGPHRLGPVRTCCVRPRARTDARMTSADVK